MIAACSCWRCRKARGPAALAPTLGAAVREEQRLRVARREQRRRIGQLERLVAHRELQLVRAQGIGRGRYIATRERKLTDARRWLAGARIKLEGLA